MDNQTSKLYAKREKRFNNVVALKRPHRVLVVPLVVHYFPTRIKGVSNRDAGYDTALRCRSIKEAVLRFGWDFAPTSGMFVSRLLEALGIAQVQWPGDGLFDDSPFQFVKSHKNGWADARRKGNTICMT